MASDTIVRLTMLKDGQTCRLELNKMGSVYTVNHIKEMGNPDEWDTILVDLCPISELHTNYWSRFLTFCWDSSSQQWEPGNQGVTN